MNEHSQSELSVAQLESLESWFHDGSAEASQALAKWIGKPSIVEIDSLEQLPLESATDLLSAAEEPICFCSAEMGGLLTGEIILAFDDASGFALADMLLDQATGSTSAWTEIATSAALETMNILSCACLNSLSANFSQVHESAELLPSPPRFSRDFAASLLEFALMGQAIASDLVVLARTSFEIDSTPMKWTMLFVPDAESMKRLAMLLPGRETNE